MGAGPAYQFQLGLQGAKQADMTYLVGIQAMAELAQIPDGLGYQLPGIVYFFLQKARLLNVPGPGAETPSVPGPQNLLNSVEEL